jgi:hypothetical protein
MKHYNSDKTAVYVPDCPKKVAPVTILVSRNVNMSGNHKEQIFIGVNNHEARRAVPFLWKNGAG